jgi:hypothetical protein
VDRAVVALGQIGPEAEAAVPALLDLWWDKRTYGERYEEIADTLEAIEPGALRRSRIERYLIRAVMAGAVLAVPVFGVLWWLTRRQRSDRLALQRWREQPNPFEAAEEPSAVGAVGEDAAVPPPQSTAIRAAEKPALGEPE